MRSAQRSFVIMERKTRYNECVQAGNVYWGLGADCLALKLNHTVGCFEPLRFRINN